jgi:hypothetical protein
MNVQEWLNQPPKPEEVFYLDEKNKTGKYIPYEIIVGKLYQLCGHEWGAYNLHVTYMNLPNRKTLVTGTIEVEVNYSLIILENTVTNEKDYKIITRRLPGGSNFVVNNTKIPYTTASIKSLAIMNAVKPLGKQFGWQLNEGEDNPTPAEGLIDMEVKPIMDMVIKKKYDKAILENDLVTICNIKTQYHVED